MTYLRHVPKKLMVNLIFQCQEASSMHFILSNPLLQIINILTIGNGSVGGFFPNGLLGAINSSAGYMDTGNGFANFPTGVVSQAPTAAVGSVDPPINGSTPATVPGMYALTQVGSPSPTQSSPLSVPPYQPYQMFFYCKIMAFSAHLWHAYCLLNCFCAAV